MLRGASVLHFGSISLAHEPARAATLRAVAIARARGLRISFDPNLRLPLWPDAAAAADAMRLGLAEAEVVKIADNEVQFLTSSCDLIEGARALWHPRLRLMVVTSGAKGALWLTEEAEGAEPGFPVSAVDATGAGDAFTAALLAALVRDPEPQHAGLYRGGEPLRRAIRFAAAAGALTASSRGAIPSLPSQVTVKQFLRERGFPAG